MGEAKSDTLDVVWGCAAIATLIGKTEKATFHMLEKRQIPARKVGRQWVASREALRRHFEGEAA